jgi:hypothetical protein
MQSRQTRKEIGMSTEWEERDEQTEPDEDDAGVLGGGGPAATIDELPGPEDEDAHLEDTEHGEF